MGGLGGGRAAAAARRAALLHLHARLGCAARCRRCGSLQLRSRVVCKVLGQQAQAVASRHARVPVLVPQVARDCRHDGWELCRVGGGNSGDLGRCRLAYFQG